MELADCWDIGAGQTANYNKQVVSFSLVRPQPSGPTVDFFCCIPPSIIPLAYSQENELHDERKETIQILGSCSSSSDSENVLPGGIGRRCLLGSFPQCFIFPTSFRLLLRALRFFPPPGLVTLIRRHHSVQFLLLFFQPKIKQLKPRKKRGIIITTPKILWSKVLRSLGAFNFLVVFFFFFSCGVLSDSVSV